jgi:hypothetical protein
MKRLNCHCWNKSTTIVQLNVVAIFEAIAYIYDSSTFGLFHNVKPVQMSAQPKQRFFSRLEFN